MLSPWYVGGPVGPGTYRVIARSAASGTGSTVGSEEHTSELQSPCNLVCRLLLEKKKKVRCDDSLELKHTSMQEQRMAYATVMRCATSVSDAACLFHRRVAPARTQYYVESY